MSKNKISQYLAEIDFEVVKKPLFILNNEGEKIELKDRTALVNDKTNDILSVMSKDYRLFTNKEFTNLSEKIGQTMSLDHNHYAIHKGGRKVLSVFNKTEKNDEMKIGNYSFKDHLVLFDSRDGSTKLSVGSSGVLNRCQNMFTSSKVQFSINHSYRLDNMIEEFKMNLDAFVQNQKEYLERLNKLQQVKITPEAFQSLIGDWTETTLDEVKHIINNPSTTEFSTRKKNIIWGLNDSYLGEAKDLDHTGFTAWNAVTHYFTHNREKSFSDLLFADFGKKEKEVISFAESLA